MSGNTLARNIRTLRSYKGVTREALANSAGISIRHLGNIERGDADPSLKTTHDIAKALQVDSALLLKENLLDLGQIA